MVPLFYAVQRETGYLNISDEELRTREAIPGFYETMLTTYAVELLQLDLENAIRKYS